jgi:hypothetical protein
VKDALGWFGVDSIDQIPGASPSAPKLAADELPTAWDWRNIDGVRYATGSKTQQVVPPHALGTASQRCRELCRPRLTACCSADARTRVEW